jgi:hypothetical protein
MEQGEANAPELMDIAQLAARGLPVECLRVLQAAATPKTSDCDHHFGGDAGELHE